MDSYKEIVTNPELTQSKYWGQISQASAIMLKTLSDTFKGTAMNVQCDHVDEAGFWFSFQLTNDSRRQIWAIRHTDLKEENN